MGNFFDELKRRNVFRVGIAYAVATWVLLQLTEVITPILELPVWAPKLIFVILAIGLVPALIFAWAFELTPEGIKREKDVDRSESITRRTGRKLDYAVITVLVIALTYFVWERQSLVSESVSESEPVAREATSAPAESIEITETSKKRSIAVIPFLYMSPDKEREWFADGLTEEILNSLARTPDLLVAARTSSFTFKGSNEDIPTIAGKLGVDHILEGSVRRSGDRLRVTAQLVRAADGFHLWSENYDRSLDDLIDIQENVAIEIAKALQTAMDPEALASMVKSGTSSVPAFEAYLQGLAFGVSTAVSGDIYEFLNARDAFEHAIELDPQFAKAYWELAIFWRVELTQTNITSGITELAPPEILPLYFDAIDKAIEYEQDPLSKITYRAQKARTEMNYRKALRLNTEHLEQRPNDQYAQILQLNLLAELSMADQIDEAIADYYERDGFDSIVTSVSVNRLIYAGEPEKLRTFTKNAIERFGHDVNVLYQAHRSLLWVGDIDGASKLVPIILASDMPEDSRYLVSLRQACAENRLEDAIRLHTQGNAQNAGDASITWLGHRIMRNDEEAVAALMPYDEAGDMITMTSFLSYGSFDPRPFPNLMAILAGQGIERAEVQNMPYQCRR